MQNTAIKAAFAALGLAGLAVSHQASAAIPTAASGNGDLVLVVVDTVTGATYAKDLGKSIGSMLPTNNASFSTDVSGDVLYQSLLTEAGSNQLSFAVVGGGFGNAAINGQSNYYASTTGGTNETTSTAVSNTNLTQFKLIDQNLITPLNNLAESANNSWFVPVGTTPNYNDASGLPTWNAKANFNTLTNVGTGNVSNFYFLTGSGSAGRSTDTLEGSMTFVAGVLNFQSLNAPSVPLPAAAWLLGSGVVGLMGIGRRRRTTV